MADDQNQPNPPQNDPQGVQQKPLPPVTTVSAPAMAMEPSKPLAPLMSGEQFQAMMDRMAELEAMTRQQARQLDAMRAMRGDTTGRVIRVHCNQCGADANTDGTLKCGHNDFINHIGHGSRIMPNGEIETVILRQTRIQ